ncbi:hypothetical protein FRC07_010102, partial [Ceratobasidium sp. 392]
MRVFGLVALGALGALATSGSARDEEVVLALGNPGINVQGWRNGTVDRLFEISHGELTSLAQTSLSTPIVTSPSSPYLVSFTSSQCAELTVDQLVHWAAHHSGRRVNSHGANVFDAPPTKVRSKAKRAAPIELCERLYRERVLGIVTSPERDASDQDRVTPSEG